MKSYFAKNYKQIIGLTIGLGIAVALYFILSPKTQADNSNLVSFAFNDAYAPYIAEYTSGLKSKNTEIKIVLQPTVQLSDSSERVPDGLFSFDPSVGGTVSRPDAYTFVFKPEKFLTSGQLYRATFDLSKVIKGIQNVSPQFNFAVQIIPLDLELNVGGLQAISGEGGKSYNLTCDLITSDIVDANAIEKIVTVRINKTILSTSWNHGENKHQFSLKVPRGQAENTLEILVDGSKIKITKTENQEIVIPAQGNFTLLDAGVVQTPEQYAYVRFSDQLADGQNLNSKIFLASGIETRMVVKTNEVRLYPVVRQNTPDKIEVKAALTNFNGKELGTEEIEEINFEPARPSIKFLGKGVIVPSQTGALIPFEATSVKAVRVKIIKIFTHNIAQFLQTNQLNGADELKRVGEPVYHKDVSLEAFGVVNYERPTRYTLDLNKLIATEPNALYRVELRIYREHSVYPCDGYVGDNNDYKTTDEPNLERDIERNNNWKSYYEDYYDEYYDYDWDERNNPCSNSYFNYTYDNTVKATRNILVSDLALTAFNGTDGQMHVLASHLGEAKPIEGANIEVLDFRQNVIAKGTTNQSGMANLTLNNPAPFLIKATAGNQLGYLRLDDESKQVTSSFDVGGETESAGIKGLWYGERGVWRPGDSIYLTFILNDKNKVLPKDMPMLFEFSDPSYKTIESRFIKQNVNNFYSIPVATTSEATTGNYMVTIKVGPAQFTKTLPVQAIKPNRLKIDIKTDSVWKPFYSPNLDVELFAEWLTGAKVQFLSADVVTDITKTPVYFDKHKDFEFNHPYNHYGWTSDKLSLKTDGEGHVQFSLKAGEAAKWPKATATFKTTVYEPGGGFSTDYAEVKMICANAYFGVSIPDLSNEQHTIETGRDYKFKIIGLDAEGQFLPSASVKVKIYKLTWQWWFDHSHDESQYMSDEHVILTSEQNVKLTDGFGSVSINIPNNDWGRYLVEVEHKPSGYLSGKIFYADWPGYAGRPHGGNSESAHLILPKSDKSEYKVGDEIPVYFEATENGFAQITIMSGSKVISTELINLMPKQSVKHTFKATADMAPNIYIHVNMYQKYGNTTDLPLRFYGILPLKINNENAKLQPQIMVAEQVEPNKPFEVSISEANAKPMTYTLAVVDEGLLALTRYKTPNPYATFYAKEALQVNIFDSYHHVFTGYKGSFERMIGIGGSDFLTESKANDATKKMRFKPAVKYLGPFTLNGGKQKHKVEIGNYIGSVRVMVVAGQQPAYGSAEKTIKVRKDLMVAPNPPRQAAIGETISVPVTVFYFGKKATEVDVKLMPSVGQSISNKIMVNPSEPTTFNFTYTVPEASTDGIEFVTSVKANGITSDASEFMPIIGKLEPQTFITEAVINPGQNANISLPELNNVAGAEAKVSFTAFPSVNLNARLDYLLNYPYGCIEQTVSSVFAQVYLDKISKLSPAQQQRRLKAINAAIARLQSFRTSTGGLAYWPSNSEPDAWGSSYALHFLAEAKLNGFITPDGLVRDLVKYQQKMVNQFRVSKSNNESQSIQAYRLLSLAVANKPDISAMNRLVTTPDLQIAPKWMLAYAYAKAGKKQKATELLKNIAEQPLPYQTPGGTYGSDLRDRSIQVLALIESGMAEQSLKPFGVIAKALNNKAEYYSTQTTAFALLATAQFAQKYGNSTGLNATYTPEGLKPREIKTGLPAHIEPLTLTKKLKSVMVKNNSNAPLYFQITVRGVPSPGFEVAENRGLVTSTTWTDFYGNPINKEAGQFEQGKQYKVTVRVQNQYNGSALNNIASRVVLPSGFEFVNNIDELSSNINGNRIDIRDDRAFAFCSLLYGQQFTHTYTVIASFVGRYYLPGALAEDMYVTDAYAKNKGNWVNIVAPSAPEM